MQPSPVVCLAVHGLFELFGFGFIFFSTLLSLYVRVQPLDLRILVVHTHIHTHNNFYSVVASLLRAFARTGRNH